MVATIVATLKAFGSEDIRSSRHSGAAVSCDSLVTVCGWEVKPTSSYVFRSRRKRPKWEANMSDVRKLLSRERMLRLRKWHLMPEAQRCHQEADELWRAAWELQHRCGCEMLEDVPVCHRLRRSSARPGAGR